MLSDSNLIKHCILVQETVNNLIIIDNDEKVTGMSKTGLYFPSGFESKGANSFSHSPRQNNDDNKVPGPGS